MSILGLWASDRMTQLWHPQLDLNDVFVGKEEQGTVSS